MQDGGQTLTRGASTRRKLLVATIKLLGERTHARINVVDIARLSGVSHTAFYIYFADVSEVILTASLEITQSTPEVLALFDEAWTSETVWYNARALFRIYLANWDLHRPLLRTRNLLSEGGDVRFLKARELSLLPLLNALSRQVVLGQGARRIDHELQPVSLAGALLAMLERLGQVGHRYDDGEAWERETGEAAAHVIAATLGWAVPG